MPTGRRLRQQKSSSGRMIRSDTLPRLRPIGILRKYSSEPQILPPDEGCRSSESGDEGVICKFSTWNDLFLFPSEVSDASSPLSRRTNVGYERDAKVVITVTVEGSPGPIRALVKLGASVEDMIKLVIQKYEEEGRTPRLHYHAASSFDLHLCYFSLQCLDRASAIGEVGSRSFYLRKSKVKSNEADATTTSTLSVTTTEIIPSSGISPKQGGPPLSSVPVLPWFVPKKMNKFVRRMHKLLKLFGCLHCR